MSKLLSEAQRNPSEEDSSGSDAGSEVSLEPETDRFGFILTNGSTAGSVGPSPELVRQREAKWINIICQWDHIVLRKSSKVKLQCQKGIPASLRAKCWSLLCGGINRMRQNKNLYETLDSQPGLQNWVDIIERDLDRQFPFHEMFLAKDGHGQRGLFRVLKAYTQFQPEEGYCQAQGPVAAVLLMNMPAEEAFWCLVQISEQYLPGYYSPLLEGVLFDAALLTWVLKKTCPTAHKHLQKHGVEPLMFATDWLMCLFTRHLPFNTLLRVWDLFFCYGVRVLLQVAVVLVRRVLGRTEQRKQCLGQMETLERLRSVKEEVQEEDDAFIAEVCSVPLSKKDLEKRMEKEFEKWRKDKPSSTFDPRGRCHGYQMAWARAQQNKEEWERKEREKGNLSIPLARSASTLSLSPSLLHKKWKKVGKVNTGDAERSNKIVRHLSMGAKEDWRSWAEVDFKKNQDFQEEGVSKGHKTKKESKLLEEKEPGEHLETAHNIVIVIVEEQAENLEENLSKEDKNNTPSEQRDEDSTNNQTDENDFQSAEVSSDCEQKLNDMNQSQNHKDNDQESDLTDTNVGTENLEEINERTSAVEDNDNEIQKDTKTEEELQENSREEPIKPEEGAETENTPEVQVDTVTEVSDTGSETNLDADQDPKADTQQEQEQVIAETKEDTSEEKYLSNESVRETENVESHAQTETETGVPVQDETSIEVTQTDLEQHTTIGTKTEEETTLPEKDTDFITDTPTEDDQRIINTTNETVQETGEIVVSEHTETHGEDGSCDRTNEETAESVIPAEETEEETSTQEEVLSDALGPDEESSAPTSETQAPEHPVSQVATGAVEDVESSEKVPENTEREDIITSTKPKDESVTGSNTHIQNESQSTKPEHSSQEQTSGRRSSRSSGDFRVRKSSSSLGSKLTRRLSEDLFTSPDKSSQFTPNHPEEQPKEVNTGQPEQTDDVSTQQEQQPDSSKRFGLFHKLRGDQPQKAKKKPKMPVPKILIQDFSDVTGAEKPTEGGVEEKMSSRERRRRRREKERKKKEEEKLKKKKEKELEKERRKPQTRGKSFQEQKKAGDDVTHPAKIGSQTLRFSASYAESYF